MKNTTKKQNKHQQSSNYPSKRTSWAYFMQAIEPDSQEINAAFSDYHPHWVQVSQMNTCTALRFTSTRESLHITREQCAAYLRVTLKTVYRWESGETPVPFVAYELLRLVAKSIYAKVVHTDWDGWFISETGKLVSPDVGGEGFTPGQLNVLLFQRSEAETLRINVTELQAQLDSAQAENTKLRQMYVAQGVVDELASMQETITELMTRIATAKIIPFSNESTHLKEKTA